MQDTVRTPEQNHAIALGELQDWIRKLRNAAMEARDTAQEAVDRYADALKRLRHLDIPEEKIASDETGWLDSIEEDLAPIGTRQFADGACNDEPKVLLRNAQAVCTAAEEAMTLRAYLAAGDFADGP